MSRYRKPISEQHFVDFAKTLEKQIAKLPPNEEEHQRNQVETLIALEEDFRRRLIALPEGEGIYRAFLWYIRKEKGNILAARPFFRERQQKFTEEISPVFQRADHKGLYPFAANYEFIRFAIDNSDWDNNHEMVVLARAIENLRAELAVQNMPLAISRARIFWSRTPESHLTYMDLVQETAMGLLAAIDKFTPPYRTAFRAVIIGRCLGNLISAYNQTSMHFYPSDRRKLYRANKMLARHEGEPDFEKVAKSVNSHLPDEIQTDPDEIRALMAAAYGLSSIDNAPVDDSASLSGDDYPPQQVEVVAASDDNRPDVQAEHRDAMNKMYTAIQRLTLLEQKLLKLKGVE